jgi:peptidoglycan/LPS O-acetylase OafA/YrhL
LDWLGVPRYLINKPGQSLGGAVISALGLYLNRYEGLHGYLPGSWDVLWSLSIEEVFYLAFPIACLTLGRARLFVPALALLALSLPFTRATLMTAGNEIWFEKAYLPGMSAIAIGVLAALLVRARPAAPPATVRLFGCAGWAGLVAIFFGGHWVWRLVHQVNGLILALSAASIVISAHWARANIKTIALRGSIWLRSWGRLSYEIYLTHMFCVFGGLALIARLGPSRPWRFLWYFPILLVCWLLGSILARGFTLPIERLLREPQKKGSLDSAAAAVEVATEQG